MQVTMPIWQRIQVEKAKGNTKTVIFHLLSPFNYTIVLRFSSYCMPAAHTKLKISCKITCMKFWTLIILNINAKIPFMNECLFLTFQKCQKLLNFTHSWKEPSQEKKCNDFVLYERRDA